MFQYTDLRDQLAEYLSEEQVEAISQAYLLGEAAHSGQKRFTGEPYITHPIEVARILATMRMDHETIIAAILHDVIEDTSLTKAQLSEKFGLKVGELVDGVSKLTQIEFNSKEEAQAENFRKMMLAMAQDIRVILIKLADRLHNMRTLAGLPPAKRRRIALETLEIYAPIAARLGMNTLRVEFEDLGFAALYPMRYRILKDALGRIRKNRKALLDSIETALTQATNQAKLPPAIVWGREKHLYSIYKKMKTKGSSFAEVMDVYAFRIIVDSIDMCYRILGIVHNFYKPVIGRFKDYIAIPKANGYQSLHTTLLGPYGVPIEVQIRTEEMDQIAENGIAAHWLYKNDEKQFDTSQIQVQTQTREWLKNLLEIQQQTGSSLEFIENVKVDLFPDEVYVFTPKGNILALPQGSTPIDFAYSVHTDVGNTCVACKINRRLAPLSTRLESGQTIDVITTPKAHPNPAWLSFAVSGKARSNIRHWLKNQRRTESCDLGKRLIERALGTFYLSIAQLDPLRVKQTLLDLGVDSFETLCEEVGLGTRIAALVAQRLAGGPHLAPNAGTALAIQGTEGLVVSYAQCCYPIPGDPIIGHLKQGTGLIIHQESCKNIRSEKDNAHYIHVRWEGEINKEFPVELKVDVLNRRGVLAMMAKTIAEGSSNIVDVTIDEHDNQHNSVSFVLSVRNRAHLARLMRRLKTISEVTKIVRIKG
jgi:GTP diphosphokinase / guanosine-3',5'-bis(diphosphate) 3'-diphosphatase